MSSIRVLSIFLIAIPFLLTGIKKIPASDFNITPSIALPQQYNDNIFFTSEDETDDLITTITPGLEIVERTERFEYNLSGRLAPFSYWDNSELDEVDQDYQGRISYRMTQRMNAGANAGFSVDNRPDREVAVTGLIFDNRKRYKQQYGLSTDYDINEITSGNIHYTHNRDDPADRDSTEKFRGHSLNFGISHHLGRWIGSATGQVNGGFGFYEYETSETKSFYGSIGLWHAFDEKVRIETSIGGRYVKSTFESLEFEFAPPFFIVPKIVEKSNTGWGGIATATLAYRGLYTKSGLTISHDLRTGSGTQGPSVLTRFLCYVDHRVMEELSFGLTAGFFKNTADADQFSFQDIDSESFNIRPRMRWEFLDNFILEGSYSYSRLSAKRE